MPVLLILAIVLPIAGAIGVLVVSRIPAAKPSAGYLALGSAALTTLCTLILAFARPALSVPLAGEESFFLGSPPDLLYNPVAGFLALAVALATLAALLVHLSRSEQLPPSLAAAMLCLLPATLVSLWGGDPLVLVMGWTLYDAILCAAQLAAGISPSSSLRTLVLGGLASALLWAGVLLSPGAAEGQQWAALAAGGIGPLAVLASGLLRLYTYPAHLAAPDQLDATAALAAPLFLGPALGWGVWLQAAADSGAVPGGGWAGLLGAAALAVGGFLAWARSRAASNLSELAMAAGGGVLLASALAGEGGLAVLAAAAPAWVLAVALLALSRRPAQTAAWWIAPGVVASLSLVGGPLTLGFVAGAQLMRQAAAEGSLLEALALFVGTAFLVAALVRWWRERPISETPRRWTAVARYLGLGLPALLLVVAGLYPPLLAPAAAAPEGLLELLGLPGWPGWLLWLASLAAGAAIAWQDPALRTRMDLVIGAARDLLRLEWLYEGALGALERALEALQTVEELVTGAGALLWSVLLLLVAALVWSS